MRILVTGGAGYIGCVLVPMLLEHGYKVWVLDNMMYPNTGLFPCFRYPDFHFIEGDVSEREDMSLAAKYCNMVIHLAAVVGFPACRKNPRLAETVNQNGAIQVEWACGDQKPVIYASTGSNYGAITDEICTEETPLNPLSIYGKTKTWAEHYLLSHCDTIALRLATAFGLSPRMRLDLLINDFVYQALTQKYIVIYEPHFMRSFIHVYDIARAFLFAIENHEKMQGQIYNVGAESMNYSKAQIAEIVRRKTDCYIHYADVGEDADKRNYVVSYKKISDLGYQTTVTLEEGIDELICGLRMIDVKNPYSNV